MLIISYNKVMISSAILISCGTAFGGTKPMQYIPVALTADTPLAESSTAMQSAGSALSREAAFRYIYGSGFPLTHSVPLTK